MSETVRKVNDFFKTALKDEIEELQDKLSLTERQDKIFRMFYVKKNDMNFIADTLNVSADTVKKELHRIRAKLSRLI